ncbi:MAG: DUF11 domain-containing protein [Thermoplasmata archaeon]|nr:MAG: DUF11 domain-containing protein [Thermoplasmata archaeon]
MRNGTRGGKSLKRANTIAVATILIFGMFVLAVTPPGEEPDTIEDWPSENEWINYTFRGERIRDWEDKPYENDPTHGIANVQPDAVDIASGVDASGGGAGNNPGNYTSVQYFYDDVNGDSDGFNNIDDDWLFLRMRVAGDPRHSGKYYYKAYHWDILLEIDGDIYSEFVVDINGGGGYFQFGTVGVYYNDTEDYEYDPDNDWVWLQEARKAKNNFTRVQEIGYGTDTEDDDQWWIEYRIPVTAFTDYDDNQLLGADTDFLLFFSTSASMTNPLQKDWMGEYVFGEPANITVEKTVEEDIVAAGDILHYKIYYNNTGEFNANHVWINDTIPEYTTFVECSPPYDSVDGRTYTWHFTDVESGNHTVYLNVSVDSDVPDGTILRNVVVLNYTDDHDEEKPGSEDETENEVEGPFMDFAKDADLTFADPGDTINYTLTYENTGSGGAYNVVITDILPDHVEFDYSVPAPTSVDGNTLTWEFGVVSGFSVNYIYVYVTVDAYTENGTYLVNFANMSYEDVNENPYPTLEDWANVTVVAPLMTISKTADVTVADPGDQIIYTIDYENTWSGDATNVVIEDTIDPDTTYVNASLAPSNIAGDVITWNIGTISGGGSGSITLIVKVDVNVEDGTTLTNIVTLNYDDANGNPQDEETDSVNVSVTAPDMTISKSADVSYADPGDEITYNITYENTGSGVAAQVWIVDTIPSYTTYVSSSPAYTSVSGDSYTWHFTNVSQGTYYITLKVKVDVGTVPGTILINNVTLDYTDANGNQPYDTEDDSATVTVTAPDITLSKEADVTTADPGDIITYNITYSNNGNGLAAHVWINDTIPTDTTFVSSSVNYTAKSGDTYTWHFTDIGPGAYYIILKVRVDVGTEPGTTLTNYVTLEYTDANGNQPYDTEQDSATVTATAPAMTISKNADVTTADPGDLIIYNITYSNNGNGVAAHVWINDTIPADTTFVSSSVNYTASSGDTYTWHFTDVNPGTYYIILKVRVDVGTEPGKTLTNDVTLDYTDANGNQPYDTEHDSAAVTATAPDMIISKNADVTTADPGDIITYTITYSNNGNGVAAHVWVNDTIPGDTTFVSSSPNYTASSGDTYTWHFTDVDPGIFYIILKVRVDVGTEPGTILTNNVTLEYTDANGNQPYDTEQDSATVTATAPDMTISKNADVSTADPGDIITYNITYSSNGNGVAAHVWVNDTIPGDTTFVSSSPNFTASSGDTYTWHFTDVDPGTYYIILKVRVDIGTAPSTILHNEVTLDYTDANGNQPYDTETDSVNVTVTAPEITVGKDADVSFADPGDIITYNITYSNNGNGVAAHVWVNDTIPDHTTFVSSSPNYTALSGSKYTWHFTDVDPGTYYIILKMRVDVGTAPSTILHNEVTLDYMDANGNQPYDTQTDSVNVTVTAPDMTINKDADVTVADPGDIITYNITYSNNGNGVAAHVWVNDTIPGDTTFVSSSPNYTASSGDTYIWHFTNVNPGTYYIILKVSVDVGTAPSTILHNEVTLDYMDANGNQPYDTQTDSVNVTVTAPDMTISKNADVTTADPGDVITYNITYSNNGNGIAAHVWVNDTIPGDTTFVSSSPNYTAKSGDTFTWHFTDVGPGTYYIIIKVKVDVGTEPRTTLLNNVTLDYTDANGNQPYDTESDFATVTATAPDMTISKNADVTTADPGDFIIYNITYSNNGNGVAAHVWVKDTIPADTTFVSSSPNYTSKSGDTFTWHFTNVDPGTYYIILKVRVDVGTDPRTTLLNNVTLDYTDANGNQPYDTERDSAIVTATAPDMTISKNADVSTADPGDFIIYNITYSNNGNGVAAHVWVKDTIPADTTYISSSPNYTAKSGDTFTWHFTNVDPGTYYITLKVKVDVGTDPRTTLLNNVTLDYTDANSNQPYDTERDSATVTATAPDITINKNADVSIADPSDIITYNITYSNNGNGVAAHVWINDTIPADTTFVSSSPNYTASSGDTFTWHFTDVDPGTCWIILKVRVDVDTPDGTTLVNEVTLDFTDDNGNQPYPTQNDTAIVYVTAPTMIIIKTANTNKADPGDTVVYTIYYENTGTGDATNVVIEDTLPENVTFEDADPYPNSTTSGKLIWNIGTVPGDTDGTITVWVTVNIGSPDGELLRNFVVLEYDDDNENPQPDENDSADVTVTAPVMSFSKCVCHRYADPGDYIQYRIQYRNSGSGNATNVVIIDTLSENMTLISSNPAYDNVSGNVYKWYIGLVGPYTHGSITILVQVNVGVEDGTVLPNKATLDYSDDNGNPYDRETRWANVTVTAPIMTIEKSADVIKADPSDYITYTIEYENTGTGEATGIVIVDTIPAYTTFINSTPAFDYQSGNSYYWNFSSVAGETNGIITIVVKVNAYTTDGTLLTNTVTLDYNDANGNPYDQENDTAEVTVTAPDMIIIKVSDVDDADPGDPIEYTLTYINRGSGIATDIVITDTIPEHTTYVDSDPTYDQVSGRIYKWINIINVGPYSSGNITITVRVNVGTADGILLRNKATLDYDDANGNPYPQENDTADVTVTAPDMIIEKSAYVITADPSDYITYTIVYTNLGTGEATDVIIVDKIPADTTFKNSTPMFDSQSGDFFTWNFSSILGLSNGTITIIVQVDAYTPDGRLLTNIATLDYNDANGNPYPQENDTAHVTVTAPVLRFGKLANVAKADPSDPIVYALTYSNIGTGVATDIVVADTIPGDTTFVSSNPSYSYVINDTYYWNVSTLAGGANGSIKITVTVNAGTGDGKLLHNSATFDYDDANGNPYPQKEASADVIVTAPVLNIIKTADVATADPDDLITYTIVFINSGTGNATDVWIVDTIPAYTTFLNASPYYDYNENDTYKWYFALVEGSTNITITILVKVDVGTPDETLLHNGVILEYSDDNGNPLDNETSSDDVIVTAPILSLNKTADVATADPDDTIIYTIKYENKGTGWASLVEIVDTIPADTTFVSASTGYNVSGDVYTWIIGNLAPNGSGIITITVKVDIATPDETTLHNEVTLDWADANGNYYTPLSAYADVRVTAPQMHLCKQASVEYADPDDTFVYTLYARNYGTGWATGVFVNDSLPSYLTLVNATPMYTYTIGNLLVWNVGTLAPNGGFIRIYITVRVNVSTPDKTKLHNVNTLDYADANGNYYPQKSKYADVIVTAPVLSLSKTASVAKANPGDIITYTIKYNNTGTGWASLVKIVDKIPAYTTFLNATPGYTISGNEYTWIIGNFSPNGTGVIVIVVKVDIPTPDGITLHNEVKLDWADANGNYYPQLCAYADVIVTAPILSITKTADKSTANPGDIITYTIIYENSGTGWATLVKIVDTIPSDTTFLNSTPIYSSFSDNKYTWIIGNLTPGGSGNITIIVRVNVPTPDQALLHNNATLDWADANGNYYPQLSDYANTFVTAPILTIRKTASKTTADPGDTITYTIKYNNTGSGWASLVKIVDTIPAETTFVSATGVYNMSGDNITWVIGNLAPNSSFIITITVTVDIPTPDETTLHNEVTLDWADANGNYYPQLSDYADVIVTAPILLFSKSTSDITADPGDTLVYTLEYENVGTGLATLVVIRDNIPIAHVTFVGASPNYTSVSGGIFTWNIGNITPGAKGTINVTVKVKAYTADKTILHNNATLSWADANGNYYPQLNDYANVRVTAPVMTLNKTADVAYADPGDTIIYTIKYTNSGTGWASLVKIVDKIPADTTFLNATPGYNISSVDEYTWTIGNVAPNSTATITIIVKVDVPTPDKTLLHNYATLDWADANGNPYPQLYDDADVYVTAPVLSITKTANVTTAYPNEPITYTIEYENTGSGWASLIKIVDTISNDTTLKSATPMYNSSSGNKYTWNIGNLKPGGKGTITIVVVVKEDTPDETHLSNYVTLDWADANGNYYPQLDDYANVTVTAPIMVLDKTADKETANPGDLIMFTITYMNLGTGWATGFYINDTIPLFTTFVDADPWYTSVLNRTYHWFIGSVAPGAVKYINLTVRVDPFTEDQYIIRNQIGNVSAEVPVTAPIMDINKTTDKTKANPGDEIVYTITYTNTGTGNASGVLINDTIPLHTTYVSSSINYSSKIGNKYVFFIGHVPANSTFTITITVMVDVGTADKTPLHNEVTLDYADVNGNYYPQENAYADAVVTAPVMSLSKDADIAKGTPGDPITYTIKYENNGTGDARSVVIVDTLPLDVKFISASPAPDNISGNILIWIIGDVLSGDSENITVNVEIIPGTWDETVLTNIVTLDYSDANDNFIKQLEDSVDVIVTAPVMTLSKEAGEVSESAYVITDIRLRVAGEKWHDVVLTLYCNNVSVAVARVYREPGDPDDQSVTLYNVSINLLCDCFSAVVVYTPFDDVINGQINGADPAWLILNTEYGKEIRIHHTFNYQHPEGWNWTIDDFRPYLINLPLTLNYTISYEIHYANIGTGDATNVWIYDVIPPETFLINSTPAFDSYIGNTLGWNIGYVPSGGSGCVCLNISFVFPNVIVKNWYPMGKLLQNNATMDYHDTNGNLVEQLSDSAEVIVYVPSELKKPKNKHYSPIYQGDGGEIPSNMLSYIGYGSTSIGDTYLVIFSETGQGDNLESTVVDSTNEDNIVHIYLSQYQLDTPPPAEEETTIIIDTTHMIQIEIPSDPQIHEVVFIEIDEMLDIQVIEFGIGALEPPEIVMIEPSITILGPVDTEEIFTLEGQYELTVKEVSHKEKDLTITVDIQEISEPPEVEYTVLEVESREDDEICLVENEETIEIAATEIKTPSSLIVETQNTASTESAENPQGEKTVSYLSMAPLLFAAIALLAGVFCWFQRRKRR